jgi:hypothetical protein
MLGGLVALALCVGSPTAQAGFTDFFKKAAKNVKDGFKEAGGKVNKGFDAMRKGFGKFTDLVKNGIDVAKKIKHKIIDKIRSFAGKLFDAVKNKAREFAFKAFETAAGSIGFTPDDIKSAVNFETGEVSKPAVMKVIVKGLGAYVRPLVKTGIDKLVELGLSLVQQALDSAVAVVVGAVGSIPVAGGVIAGAISFAYSAGIKILKAVAGTLISKLLFDHVVNPLLEKGVDALFKLGGRMQALLDGLVSRTMAFFKMIKHPDAVCTLNGKPSALKVP